MKFMVIAIVTLSSLISACTYYNDVAVDNDKIYLTGARGFIFYESWVKQCRKDESTDTTLACKTMIIREKTIRGGTVGEARSSIKRTLGTSDERKKKSPQVQQNEDEMLEDMYSR